MTRPVTRLSAISAAQGRYPLAFAAAQLRNPGPTDINTYPPDIRINVFYHQTYTAKTARREQPAAEGPRGRSVAKEARGVAKPEAQRLDARVQNIGRG